MMSPLENPSRSRTVQPPRPKLPANYSPNATLPPNYRPPIRDDLQKTGALARQAQRTSLSRRQVIMLALGGVGVIVVMMIVAILIIGAIVVPSTLGGPNTTLQTYYSALRTQDYDHAYDQFSASAKTTLTKSAFASRAQQLDLLNGPIAQFTIDNVSVNGSHATAAVHVTRSANTDHVTLDTISLTQTSGTWNIDSIVSRDQAAPTATAQP